MTLRLDHVAIPIRDPDATHNFYSGVLGLPLVSAMSGGDWGGKEWLMLIYGLGDDRQLALIAFRGASPEAQPAGLPKDSRHYALAAADLDALSAWRKKISAAGLAFWEEDHGDQKSLYFEDPNGVMLEITAPPTASPKARSARAEKILAGWTRAK